MNKNDVPVVSLGRVTFTAGDVAAMAAVVGCLDSSILSQAFIKSGYNSELINAVAKARRAVMDLEGEL